MKELVLKNEPEIRLLGLTWVKELVWDDEPMMRVELTWVKELV